MKTNILFAVLCTSLLLNASAQIAVDYRIYQSPVKNQVDRGTCTAFAVLAAMETLPGMPNDLSEQYLYAAAKSSNYKQYGNEYGEGAALEFYKTVLTNTGTVREDQEPYNPNAVVWQEDQSSFEQMRKDLGGTGLLDLLKTQPQMYKLQPNSCTYREYEQARDVAWIKQQLDNGTHCIPVSYKLSGAYWWTHPASRSNKIDPSGFMQIADANSVMDFGLAKLMYGNKGIVERLGNGTLEARFSSEATIPGEGHAVAIVGYDDSGFLIKNSWGTAEWGQSGYGWISFDYHELFAIELLILGNTQIYTSDYGAKNAGGFKQSDLHLKVLPHSYNSTFLSQSGKGLSVSLTYHGDAYLPKLSTLKYTAYDAYGSKIGEWTAITQGIVDMRNVGYNTYIANKEGAASFPTVAKIVAQGIVEGGGLFVNTYTNIQPRNGEYRPQ